MHAPPLIMVIRGKSHLFLLDASLVHARRYAAYILIGIYVFWFLVYLAGVITRCILLSSNKIRPAHQAPEIQLGSSQDDDDDEDIIHNPMHANGMQNGRQPSGPAVV